LNKGKDVFHHTTPVVLRRGQNSYLTKHQQASCIR
jgi:hypothetical protein